MTEAETHREAILEVKNTKKTQMRRNGREEMLQMLNNVEKGLREVGWSNETAR